MAVLIQMELNDKLYLRNPQDTKLGKKIIQYSIILIDEIGFEKFTFKKLAQRIESTEASVYRYFENKHNLLVYLVSWYWEWMRFLIDYNTMNMEDPLERLRKVLHVIVETSKQNPLIDYIDESILHRIVIAESSKAYHTKAVDKENKEGFFLNYKSLCIKIGEIISEINPDFPYPHALASTILEMANNHIYYAQHLPVLTEITMKDEHDLGGVVELLEYFTFGLVCDKK